MIKSSQRRLRIHHSLLALLMGSAMIGSTQAADSAPDIQAGKKFYENTCVGCHAVSIAPSLVGVVGRKVAGEPSFLNYSDALKKAGDRVWTKEELDVFLKAPRERIPGTVMLVEIKDDHERANLIAYLATLTTESAENVAATATNGNLPSRPFAMAVRRLNESRYRNSITDIFGEKIKLEARFEPERRADGLLAVGNSDLSLTSTGFEQRYELARSISAQVLGKRSTTVKACESANNGIAQCARDYVREYGQRLFRRPLTDAEVEQRVKLAEDGFERTGSTAKSLQLALTSLLVAPEFLFIVETAEPDPKKSGAFRLDGYTRAARLSFLFWNTTPDDELLEAARRGKLYSARGLKKQVNRLIESPRYEQGVRAFFSDLMQLEGFDNLIKDPTIYPKFNQTVAYSAREQMLKTVVELLVNQRSDYRELFTSTETFINRPLAAIYNVPYLSSEEWAPYSFSSDTGRSGILTSIGYLSLFAHAGSSSPTRRGIKLHEIFMCEPTPDPPADVDFSKTKDSTAKTSRGRLLDHMENTGCVACHRRSDPPGLALEHFDGIGQLRKYENGQLIDVSATLNGIDFVGAAGLGEFLNKDKRVPACMVRNVYAYNAGYVPSKNRNAFLERALETFVKKDYQLPALMAWMASSPEFYEVVIPDGLDKGEASASLQQASTLGGAIR